MTPLLYLETNWIIGAVMGQDSRADELLSLAPTTVHLHLPEICLMEAVSAFDRKKAERKELREVLSRQVASTRRSLQVPLALSLTGLLTEARLRNDELLNLLYERLDRYLVRACDRMQLLPTPSADVGFALDLAVLTGMGRADALILASVVAHSRAQRGKRMAFLTANVAEFELARAQLDEARLKLLGTTEAALGWLSAQMAD